MNTWLVDNVVGMIGILVAIFIAVRLYSLSKHITLMDRLNHKDEIRDKVETILHNTYRGHNGDVRLVDVELINVKKYLKHYPHNNDKNRDGYTYIKGELKSLRYDGVELFCDVKAAYYKPDGRLSLCHLKGANRANFDALEAGLVPYEWIEYVDPRGGEFGYRPQFFVRFKGPKKSPYKYFSYYQESDTYNKDNDPMIFKWRRVDIE